MSIQIPGSLATKKEFFGDCSRYAVYGVHTRFNSIEWMVSDAETIDPVTNMPAIIRQGDSRDSVMVDFND